MTRATTYLFHVRGGDGVAHFFHPFTGSLSFLDQLRKTEVEGRYGAEPRIESISLLRKELYEYADSAVNKWVAERWFTPRFVFSACAFLIAYFFFSYVIRDPLPMIDELIAGIFFGIVTFRSLGKKYRSREEVEALRKELKERIDKIQFQESSFIRKIESLVQELEGISVEMLLEQWRRGEKLALHPEEMEEAEEFLSCLELRIPPGKRNRFLYLLETGRVTHYLRKKIESPELFLILYLFLKRSLA